MNKDERTDEDRNAETIKTAELAPDEAAAIDKSKNDRDDKESSER